MPSLKQLAKSRTNTILFLLLLCLATAKALADIKISGIKDEANNNVKLMLALQKIPCDAPKWKIQGLFDNSDREIDQALRALGYYHAVIKKSLAFTKRCWKADFNINPGPRITVSKLDIVIKGLLINNLFNSI